MSKPHICRECGCDLKPLGLRAGAVFCGPKHRKDWHNRRAVRGAEMYDLIMANAFERDKRAGVLSMLSRLASAYRDADKAKRDGRKSWDLGEAIERIPLAFGASGDKR